MSHDYPVISFPPAVFPHGQNREVFAYYGNTGHVFSDDGGEVTCQNLKTDRGVGFSAVQPVLPLSNRPEKVRYPWPDRVMGDTLNKNKKIKTFIQQTRMRQNWYKKLKKHIAALESIRADAEQWKEKGCDIVDDFTGQLHPRLQKHLANYMEVADSEYIRYNNSMYAGGCLGHLEGDIGTSYLISPCGQNFNNLKLRRVIEDTEGLLMSNTVFSYPMSQSVYEVNCDTVQNQGLMTVRTETSCHLFGIDPDSSENAIQELHSIERPGERFTSAKLSPYIPGECLLTTEGTCLLWANGNAEKVYGPTPPRFSVSDNWCSGHFGSHPRQVIYTDLCAVQLLDLRVNTPEAIDLLALPNKGFHNRERIRLCGAHKTSSFYHVVGTDYSLVIIDERFVKHPVLQWDHLLTTPPQYLNSLSYPSAQGTEGLTYIASQYPPDIHGFKFAVKQGLPPQRMSVPWRAAQFSDLSKWKPFIDDCSNPHLLRNRVDASLAGFTTVPWQTGHAVYQLNCHGEIFYQVFKATSSDQDVTFSAGLGSHDLKPLPVATKRAKAWIATWEKHTRAKRGDCIEINLSSIFENMMTSDEPNTNCSLCSSSPLAGSSNHTDTEDLEKYKECRMCNHSLKDGNQLMQSAKKGGVTSSDIEPSLCLIDRIKDPDKLPATSALSRLLLKRWEKDEDLSELQKDRDKEVMQHWKELLEGKNKGHQIEEPSLRDRILGSNQSKQTSQAARTVSESERTASESERIVRERTASESERTASGSNRFSDYSVVSDMEGEDRSGNMAKDARIPGSARKTRVSESSQNSQRTTIAASEKDGQDTSGEWDSLSVYSVTSVESGSKHKRKSKKSCSSVVNDVNIDVIPSSAQDTYSRSPASITIDISDDRENNNLFLQPSCTVPASARTPRYDTEESDGSRSLFSSPNNRKRKRHYSSGSSSSRLSYTPRMASSNTLSFTPIYSVQGQSQSSSQMQNISTQGFSSQSSGRNVNLSQTVMTQSPRKEQRHSVKKKTFTAGF